VKGRNPSLAILAVARGCSKTKTLQKYVRSAEEKALSHVGYAEAKAIWKLAIPKFSGFDRLLFRIGDY